MAYYGLSSIFSTPAKNGNTIISPDELSAYTQLLALSPQPLPDMAYALSQLELETDLIPGLTFTVGKNTPKGTKSSSEKPQTTNDKAPESGEVKNDTVKDKPVTTLAGYPVYKDKVGHYIDIIFTLKGSIYEQTLALTRLTKRHGQYLLLTSARGNPGDMELWGRLYGHYSERSK